MSHGYLAVSVCGWICARGVFEIVPRTMLYSLCSTVPPARLADSKLYFVISFAVAQAASRLRLRSGLKAHMAGIRNLSVALLVLKNRNYRIMVWYISFSCILIRYRTIFEDWLESRDVNIVDWSCRFARLSETIGCDLVLVNWKNVLNHYKTQVYA